MIAATNICACGCGELLSRVRSDAEYASAACRTRAYRAREEAQKASPKRHAGKGQRQRVLEVLHAVGGRGITQVDFLGRTPDGGAPITRLAARINELRDEGHRIEHRGRRDSCVVYVLADAPTTAPTPPPTPPDRDDATVYEGQISIFGEAA